MKKGLLFWTTISVIYALLFLSIVFMVGFSIEPTFQLVFTFFIVTLCMFPFFFGSSKDVRERFRNFVFDHELREYHFWLIIISLFITANIIHHYQTSIWWIPIDQSLVVFIIILLLIRPFPCWWFYTDIASGIMFSAETYNDRVAHLLRKRGFDVEEFYFDPKIKKYRSGLKIPKRKLLPVKIIAYFDTYFFPGREIDYE